jgi:hypothetical protein
MAVRAPTAHHRPCHIASCARAHRALTLLWPHAGAMPMGWSSCRRATSSWATRPALRGCFWPNLKQTGFTVRSGHYGQLRPNAPKFKLIPFLFTEIIQINSNFQNSRQFKYSSRIYETSYVGFLMSYSIH